MNNLPCVLRQLARAPGFTIVAVLTLALGIGFSTSSFSMANTFLLRDVPYAEPEQLVRVFRTTAQMRNRSHAPANMMELRDAAKSFSGMAIFNPDLYALGEPGHPAEQVQGLTVTANFFELLRVRPVLGRLFMPDEDQPDKEHVAVISHRAWERRYGGDRGVIGRAVRLNGLPFTIVGVLPEAFEAPLVWGYTEFITPRTIETGFRTQRSSTWMSCVARLKPGISIPQADSEVSVIAARLAREHPKENATDGMTVVALHDSNMDGVSRLLLWLMPALAVTMLLIACANLASLQVARAFGRSREFAVRAALGGDRRQLMVPLLLESLLLSCAGGLAALLVASWSNDIIGGFLRINNEDGYAIALDRRVFAFAAAASLLSGIAFGLAPAWLAARAPAAEALKEGARSTTGAPSHQRIKRALIIAEVALALALVAVAASFGVAARNFFGRDVGWKMDGLFVGSVALPYNRYSEDPRVWSLYHALLERLAALPGVQHAAVSTNLPLYGIGGVTRIVVDGQPPVERGREPTAELGRVSADYFATLEIPLRQGAFFPADFKPDAPQVAIINESFAKRFWPGESAIGRRVRVADSDQWLEIVGVVGDVRMAVRPDAPETRLHLYRPIAQSVSRYVSIIVRGAAPPETYANPVREAVAALDPDQPVAQPGNLRVQVDRALANVNMIIVNLGISAGMGLLIASVGLFGVISQLTAQRTRDIGVRMALGAQESDILRLILGEGIRLLAIGIAVGVPLFLALNVVIRRAMPEMQQPGLWLLGLNLATLSAAMLLATYLPARRATQINPVEALRAE